MSVLNSSTAAPPSRIVPLTRQLAPGIALAAAVAVAASLSAPRIATVFPIPAMVIALLLGIALNGLASQKAFEPGLAWCVKKLLRIAIGLLGIRIALGDIVDLGLGVALLVVLAMVLTVAAGFWLARFFQLDRRLRRARGRGDRRVRRLGDPRHRDGRAELSAEGRRRDLHGGGRQRRLDPRHGRSIRRSACCSASMRRRLGSCSGPPSTTWRRWSAPATPSPSRSATRPSSSSCSACSCCCRWCSPSAGISCVSAAKPARPRCRCRSSRSCSSPCASSTASRLLVPGLAPVYGPVKSALVTASNWGLLLAIAALGLGTSLTAILRIGWRHIAVFTGTTLVILGVVTAGLLVLA